jgi:hypothetical protein
MAKPKPKKKPAKRDLKALSAQRKEPLLKSAYEGAGIVMDRVKRALPKMEEEAHDWMRGKR